MKPRYVAISSAALESFVPSLREIVWQFVWTIGAGLCLPSGVFVLVGLWNRWTIGMFALGLPLMAVGIWRWRKLHRARMVAPSTEIPQ